MTAVERAEVATTILTDLSSIAPLDGCTAVLASRLQLKLDDAERLSCCSQPAAPPSTEQNADLSDDGISFNIESSETDEPLLRRLASPLRRSRVIRSRAGNAPRCPGEALFSGRWRASGGT